MNGTDNRRILLATLIKRYVKVKGDSYDRQYATSDLNGWLKARFNLVNVSSEVPEDRLSEALDGVIWTCRNN
jgi:hypothetical protein